MVNQLACEHGRHVVVVGISYSMSAPSASSATASKPAALPTLETKVVILGHSGVGKTSMLNQFVRGSFTGNTTATIGAAFMKKTMVVDGYTIILQIWDTAGQERFRSMAPMYYRGANAAVLVFDVTSAETLEKVGGWADELSGHTNDDMVMVVAANKSDLKAADVTSPPSSPTQSTSLPASSVYPSSLQSAAQHYAHSIHAAYFETSAKTGKGIDELFSHIARALLKQHVDKQRAIKQSRQQQRTGKPVTVQQRRERHQQDGGCC